MLLSLRVGTRIVSLLTEEEDEEIGVLVGWGSRRDSEKILGTSYIISSRK